MNLPTLILVAVVIPLTVLAVAWLFGEALGWLAPRPRLRSLLFVGLGAAYLASAWWEAERGLALGLRIAMGVLWIGWGSWEFRRGQVGTYE
ncbi:MAG TPA: hypothetical protein VFV54_03760 [Thermoanaerobaculia bacterium]|nr:hypothetical protein [Thermoanaerobaculia bacterium]